MTQLKSISVGEIFDKKEAKDNIGKPVCCVAGYVVSEFTHAGKYGESTGFKGDFTAMNYITGEIFESEAFFPPKNLALELTKKLKEGHEVEFKAEIRPIASDKNDKGYAWTADAPITKERLARRNEMKVAMERFREERKLLTAPKDAAKKKTA